HDHGGGGAPQRDFARDRAPSRDARPPAVARRRRRGGRRLKDGRGAGERARGGGVTSAARQQANRANALVSTGPRTSAGKAISARNARRHGLNLPALRDPALADEIAALGREIARPGAPARRFELACRIAAAQLDLLRVRRARPALFSRKPTARAAAVDRAGLRALARRKFAIRELDAAGGGQSLRGLFWRNEPNTEKPPRVILAKRSQSSKAAVVHFGETKPIRTTSDRMRMRDDVFFTPPA